MSTLNDPFDGVSTFLMVAQLKSFRGAAERLGVTPAAVSKAVRQMESRHDVALFQRTTRRVALTEAGAELYARLRPASADIADALLALGGHRDAPRGTLRISAPGNTREFLLARLLPRLRARYPALTLDISIDDGFVDLVERGFDAGIRLGEAVAQDMVAVRITPPITWSIVATPAYFARHGRPASPAQLIGHEAIRYRFISSQAIHRWQFRVGRRAVVIDVGGGLIVDDRALLVELACQGLGVAFVADNEARTEVQAGKLEAVLQDFIPVDDGMYLYFPARSQSQPKLRALIDMARELSVEAEFLAGFVPIAAGATKKNRAKISR